MSVYELMAKLGAAGIKLWVEEGQLKFKAPKGALTAELKAELIGLKAEVIDFLSDTKTSSDSSVDTIPVIDHSQPLRLSFAQNRLWFIEQLAPGTSTFHIPAPLQLTGQLDHQAMELAFQKLIARHEVLRTGFHNIEDEPRQTVDSLVHFSIPLEDLTDTDVSELDKLVKDKIEREIRTPFDLSRAPLIRAKIYKLADHKYAMVIVLHHIVTDGWSMGIFVRELAGFYAAASSGFGFSLEPLPIQYADFAEWQRDWLQGDVLEKQLSYWRKQLTNAPALLTIPTDFPRPELMTNNGSVINVHFNDELTQAIRTIARQFDCTAYVVLMAAYKMLLARWSGQTDICVGMPVAGRTQAQTEPLIGFFVNQLVIRTRQSGGQKFSDFIQQVKQKILGAQGHQDVPFEAIVDALNVPRNLSYSPVFQAALSLTGADSGEQSINVGGLSIKPLAVDLIAARLEMTLMLVDHGSHFSGMMEYNTDLFKPATMQLFVDQYQSLLLNIASDVHEVLSNIETLSPSELRRNLQVDASTQVLPLSPYQSYCFEQYNDSAAGIGWYATELPNNVTLEQATTNLQAFAKQQPTLRTRLIAGNLRGIRKYYQCFDGDVAVYQQALPQSVHTTEAAIRACREVLSGEDQTSLSLISHHLVSFSDGKSYYIIRAHRSVLDQQSALKLLVALHAPDPLAALGTVSELDLLQWLRSIHRQTDTVEAIEETRSWFQTLEPETLRLTSDTQARQNVTETFDSALVVSLRDWCGDHGIAFSVCLQSLFMKVLDQSYYRENALISSALMDSRRTQPNVEKTGFIIGQLQQETLLAPQPSVLSHTTRCSLQDGQWLEIRCDLGVLDCAETSVGSTVSTPMEPKDSSLFLSVTELGKGCTFSFSYPENAFSDTEILQRLKKASEQLVKKDSIAALSLELLEAEEQQLLQWQSGVAKDISHNSLTHWLQQSVQKNPQHPAVICGNSLLNYAEFDRLSTQIAHWILATQAQTSVKTQSKPTVAICIDRTVSLPAVYWGAIKSGTPYVPMDINYPGERILHILEDSRAQLFITEASVLERFKQEGLALPAATNVVLIEDLLITAAGLDSTLPLPAVSPDSLLYYVYTSGSTGKPKGAGVYHRGEVNLIQWYSELLALSPTDRVLLISALGFDLTQKNLFVALCNGASLVIPDFAEYDPDRLVALLVKQNISVVNCAPSAFYPLVENSAAPGYPFALRHVVLGGEPIRTDILQPWLNHPSHACVLTNSYGPTECTDVVAAYSLSSIEVEQASASLPIGRPLPNVQFKVVNAKGESLHPGATGELCIGGLCVGSGYLNQPELNATVFTELNQIAGERWYHTGDLVYFNASGELVYVGRKDFQLKLRGLRIEPDEINALLKGFQGISDALTLVVDERLVSFVLSSQPAISAQQQDHPTLPDQTVLKDSLAQHLPEFMIPAQIIILNQWPLTPNGKVDRGVLAESARQQGIAYVAPRNATEERLAAVWSQVLKQDSISVVANFFELGGHSLLATQVISRVRQAFKVELSVRALFEAPTIEQLARLVATAAASGLADTAPPLVALNPPNRDTLSFAQYRLWFVDQLNQGSSEYNLPYAMKIKGPLQLVLLDRVFTHILQRHEVLRTRFLTEDGVPKLVVDEIDEWHCEVTDLSDLTPIEQNQQISSEVDKHANQVFSLTEDLLFNCKVLRLGAEEHVLLLNMHHIVSDGWSMGIMVQEIQALYLAFSRGQSSPLLPLSIQYADFAVWQRQWLSGEVLERLTRYWQEALAGAPDVLRLPTDKPRPKVQTFNGAHYSVGLGIELSQQVTQYCERHDVTPFMVLIGAYHILLSRYSGQNDICVGIPIAGRNRTEIEGLIGFFINGLVIRSRLQDNPSVSDYLQQVKETSLGAYAHQDMPADLLLDALKMERSADTSPGAQVGFALQNLDIENFNAIIAGLEMETVAREHKTSKYELSLILQEQGGEYTGVMEYNTDLFVASTMEQMWSHYVRILDQMLEHPHWDLEQIQLLQPADLPRLLNLNVAPEAIRSLTPMQRDMVLDTQVQPDTLKNSLGYHFLVAGEFDIDCWQRALQQVIDDQPLLRARLIFSELGYADVAYLCIDPKKSVKLNRVDLSQTTTTDQQAANLAKDLVWQPYALDGELAEYYVYQLDKGRTLVVVRMNHIIMDGAAMAVHLQNALAFYEAEQGQGMPTYQPAPDVFPQYVEDNRRRTDRHEVIEFWQQQAQRTEALDFSLPHGQELPSGRVEKTLTLSREHWAEIQNYCEAKRITPSLYFKALYGLLIKAYCRAENDFYITEVTVGRTGVHRRALGNYFQVLPIVFNQALFSESATVHELMDYIRHYRKALRTNAQVSLMTLSRTLPQGRLQFMFNYYNFIPTISLLGEEIPLTAYPQCQDGPVQFVVEEQTDTVSLNLIYMAELFADLEFLPRVEQLSQQIVQGQDSIQELGWQLPQEQQRVQTINHLSNSEALPFESVLVGLEKQVLATPQAIAVRFGDQQLSYLQLHERSNQMAHWLQEAGVKHGDRVAICLDRSANMIVAVLAVLKAEAVYVPLDSNYPVERLSYIINDCSASVLITQDCVLDHFKEAAIDLSTSTLLNLDKATEWDRYSKQAPIVKLTATDPIYMIYTSGSTGKPKGVVVNHGGEVNLQQWYLSALNLSAQDKVLLVSAFGFDLTQKNIFAPLLVGAALVIPAMEEYDVDCVKKTIAQNAVSIINCAPSMFYPLVDNIDGNPYPSLRMVILGGEPIRLGGLQQWFKQSGCRLLNSYGPTECTDVVAYHEVDTQADPQQPIPIGMPIGNTSLYVVDSNGSILPTGVVGELCIGGIGVGEGYFRQPELTRQAFSANPFGDGRWYRTGDLVRRWPDGNIEFIGRKDFQVKLRGLRIELAEIETALQAQTHVSDSLTLVKDERLVSYLISQEKIDAVLLKNELRKALPGYMVPAVFVVLDQWPLTPNGKIDRENLPQPDQSERPPYVAPRNETEETLVAIWQEILGIDKIGVHDSFFDLGGHSLLAARAVSKFRQAFEVDIQLRALFELHTVEDIAQYVDTMRWAAEAATQSADLSEDQEGREQGFL